MNTKKLSIIHSNNFEFELTFFMFLIKLQFKLKYVLGKMLNIQENTWFFIKAMVLFILI